VEIKKLFKSKSETLKILILETCFWRRKLLSGSNPWNTILLFGT
jgi:hypothetical protein